MSLRMETQLRAVKHRALQRTASVIAEMDHSPKRYTASTKVLEVSQRQEVTTKPTWNEATADALLKKNPTHSDRQGERPSPPGLHSISTMAATSAQHHGGMDNDSQTPV